MKLACNILNPTSSFTYITHYNNALYPSFHVSAISRLSRLPRWRPCIASTTSWWSWMPASKLPAAKRSRTSRRRLRPQRRQRSNLVCQHINMPQQAMKNRLFLPIFAWELCCKLRTPVAFSMSWKSCWSVGVVACRGEVMRIRMPTIMP